MFSERFLEDLSPYARLTFAVAPFVIAIILRVILGRNRLTGVAITLGTLWLAVSVLMAPFSAGMQRDLDKLPHIFG